MQRHQQAAWAGFLLVSLILSFIFASASVGNDVLIVHYKRFAGDYDNWTLWTWDARTGQDSQELERVDQDDYGLIFHVVKSSYGEGREIGLLPKFKEWESKDPPDRIWTSDMGDEIWVLSGHPQLLTTEPGEELMGKDVGPVLTVHYHRPQGDYSGWTLWTWDDQTDQDSREISTSEMDDYGMVFEVRRKDYGGDGMQIGLLPKYGNWSSKDPPDRIWYPHMGSEVWILTGNEELFNEMPDTTPWVIGAFVDGMRVITVSLSAPLKTEDLRPANITLKDGAGKEIEVAGVRLLPPRKGSAYLIAVSTGKDFDVRDPLSAYTLTVKGFKPANLTVRGILDGPEFHSDKKLGAIYSADQTTFRVFAPTAASVRLMLYDDPAGGQGQPHDMEYTDNGIWERIVGGDLIGKYYTLKAYGADPRFEDVKGELIDPYSRCNTAHNGRGKIVDDKTPIASHPVFDKSEAVIYELHVRDFTIAPNSGIVSKGKYLGFTETGTTVPGHPEVKTGIDHLEDLGVNVIHIMPIQDFENDESSEEYNWGYMPVHFNSPDGWFATETSGATRVEEFKRLVDALHKKGMKVVMDVVYNHTAEYRPQRIYSFEGLVPGYYYRLRDDGSYWNGSGTGNETRSEAPMMRKFIVESCKYWVTEYDIDGYRFDLLGLIDIGTVIQIVKELKAIKPDIIVYGEPWTGGETPISPTVKGTQRGKDFSVFGDHFRDAIKGGVFDLSKGYVQAGVGIDRIKRGIEGSINDFAESPLEVINYCANHDNHTLWDRLIATTRGDTAVEAEDRKRMDKLAAALVLTSQGIPFIHSGQEMLRTKRGNSNSYNQPDAINMINWDWKRDNMDIFSYYKGLIALRKTHPIFRMRTRDEITANLKFFDDHLSIRIPGKCVAYRLTKGNSGDVWDEVLVLFNANPNAVTFTVPDGKWTVVVNDDEAGTKPVKTGTSSISGRKVEVAGISAMVLYR